MNCSQVRAQTPPRSCGDVAVMPAKGVEQMAKPPRILLAGLNDDEIANVEDSLGDIDCQIEIVAVGSAVFDRLQGFQPHLVVLDTAIEGKY